MEKTRPEPIKIQPTFEVEKTIEHYKIISMISDEGTYGTAYLCKDQNTDEKVCVKIFRDVDKANTDN